MAFLEQMNERIYLFGVWENRNLGMGVIISKVSYNSAEKGSAGLAGLPFWYNEHVRGC